MLKVADTIPAKAITNLAHSYRQRIPPLIECGQKFFNNIGHYKAKNNIPKNGTQAFWQHYGIICINLLIGTFIRLAEI